MNVKHAGDIAFAGSVGGPATAWMAQLETGLTILVLAISAIAGIYSIVWNRIRLNNERKQNESSKRNDSRRTP